MNVLFLTLSNIENIEEGGIYTDLIRELRDNGITVYVASPRERRYGEPTELINNDSVNILKVKTGNITKTKSYIEKGISTVMIEYQFLRAIKKYFGDIKFDLVMYSTPPISFVRIIKYLKDKNHCKTYLILKDIFPQNAVDIGVLKEHGLIWRYFRRKETNLYKVSDYIGCMSYGNVEYIKNNNKLDGKQIEIFPNAIKPVRIQEPSIKNCDILIKYGIPKGKVIFIYGGNLGKPQGISFILSVIDNFYRVDNGFLLIVGSGTEYYNINKHINETDPKNVKLIEWMPKNEYNEILKCSDVGLIFLDHRFTIPNIPSRLLSYYEYSKPILAATDPNTDLKEIIAESQSGFWCESDDIEKFIEYANKMSNNQKMIQQLGENGRRYLEENFNIEKTIKILINHLMEGNNV
ncbi:MAG: glycosyltransferase family 4 protein [Tissierellales bacterium]|nr:glycosyltransferase family 4 protein [Tissierellales bacterium]